MRRPQDYSTTYSYYPIKELLRKERKNEFLTADEKKTIQKYAEEQRKKRLK